MVNVGAAEHSVAPVSVNCCLEGEEQQEGHHKTEKTHGFRQGETQDGIGEQLLLERWVPGITDDERTEHCSNSGT